jgi:hypothetical protein
MIGRNGMQSASIIGHQLGVLLGEAEIKRCNNFAKALDVINSDESRCIKRFKLEKIVEEERRILKY